MSEDRPADDLMQYDRMAQEALRAVVKAAIERAGSPHGLPGQHHLYITYKTRAHGAVTPEDLMERYPDDMTIVLQHQFWDLTIDDRQFSVTLRFGGQPKRLVVPFSAITRFYDPSVQFLLQSPEPEIEAAEIIAAPMTARTNPEPAPAKKTAAGEKTEGGDEDGGGQVVSLDQFRKK